MVVALVVIGPERLPGVARKVGKWVGRGRQFVRTIKSDIDRELAADELRSILKQQSESNPLHEIVEETRESLGDASKAYMVDAVEDTPGASTTSSQDTNPDTDTDLNSTQDDTKR